jgi:hypothetical protein
VALSSVVVSTLAVPESQQARIESGLAKDVIFAVSYESPKMGRGALPCKSH